MRFNINFLPLKELEEKTIEINGRTKVYVLLCLT